MGNCGEVAAEKHGITRESLDAHALESYARAARAWNSGAFDAEVVPITIKGKKGDTIVKEDEEYKKVIPDKVPSLRSGFKQGGVITAANSSPLSDGASALILTSAAKAEELGLKPLAKIICMTLFITCSFLYLTFFQLGQMLELTRSISLKHQLRLFLSLCRRQISLLMTLPNSNSMKPSLSLFVLPRSFAALMGQRSTLTGTCCVCEVDHTFLIHHLSGAVALGHAIGNSGSRIVVSLVHSLKSGEYGAAGICNGVSAVY